MHSLKTNESVPPDCVDCPGVVLFYLNEFAVESAGLREELRYCCNQRVGETRPLKEMLLGA